jgi:LAO/AO transport system kinase
VTYSALTGDGIADLWGRVLEHRERLTGSGELARRRREQQVKWMWTMLDDRLFTRLKTDPGLRARLPALEAAVAEGRLSPALAVDEIARAMGL